MASEVECTITADGKVFIQEVDRAADAARGLGDQARRSGQDTEDAFDNAARSTGTFGAALDTAQGSIGQVGDSLAAVGDAAGSLQDILEHGERKALEVEQAHIDLEQATNDMAQAMEDAQQAERDLAQAGIDLEQAALDNEKAIRDQEDALKAYNEAVKKHGKNSDEAKDALHEYKQAGLDVLQTEEDMAQAERDAAQAKIDSKQASTDLRQANLDAADSNQQLEESGSALTKVAEWGGMLSGVLGGLVGVLGVVTVAQWALNSALLASPITWIVLAIGALVAAIVLIATKTKWFQTIWRNVWGWVKDFVTSQFNAVKTNVTRVIGAVITLVGSIKNKAKGVLRGLADTIISPFRSAFNSIAGLWNRTVGSIGFTVPSWVPGVGGNSFSVPDIPTLAVGGDILRTGLAVVHRGERIVPTARAQRLDMAQGRTADMADGAVKVLVEFKSSGSDPWEEIIIDYIKNNVRVKAVLDSNIRQTVSSKGGSVQTAYGKRGVS